MWFQLTKEDNLAENICKNCAAAILKSSKFRLKYIESERKLRNLIDQSEDDANEHENLLNVEVNIEEAESSLQTMLDSSASLESRWKCNLCLSSFASRSQYRDHRRLHRSTAGSDVECSMKTTKESGKWKCAHCPAEFRMNKMKLKHEEEQHNVALNEPLISINDSDDSFLPNISGVGDDEVQNEFNLAEEEPEMDLGLYLIDKHSEISNFDPLEISNYNNSLLVPINDNFKWQCRVCPEKFRTRDLLREHNHLHAPRPKPKPKPVKKIVEDADRISRWQCKTCKIKFGTRELLRIHRRTNCTSNESTEANEPEDDKEMQVSQSSKKMKIDERTDE